MCQACGRQERVCPQGHRSPKHHGDVFFPERTNCPTCGEPTKIQSKPTPPPPITGQRSTMQILEERGQWDAVREAKGW